MPDRLGFVIGEIHGLESVILGELSLRGVQRADAAVRAPAVGPRGDHGKIHPRLPHGVHDLVDVLLTDFTVVVHLETEGDVVRNPGRDLVLDQPNDPGGAQFVRSPVRSLVGRYEAALAGVVEIGDDGTVISDRASLDKASVTAEIIGDSAGPKVDIFKYKNKTGYRRRQGHRQKYTKIKVTKIKAGGTKKKAASTKKADKKSDDSKAAKADKKAKDADAKAPKAEKKPKDKPKAEEE